MDKKIQFPAKNGASGQKRGRVGKVISVASGKGGVGKTLTAVNIAVSARRMGKSVLILDGDLGLSNVDVVLGLQARYNIFDIIEERVSLKEIIIECPLGIHVIPSGSGISQLTELTRLQRVQLMEQIAGIDQNYDLLIIDTGAGISSGVLHLNAMADKIIVVTTPEPHAMTDAYAFIKVMHEEYGRSNACLLVNMVKSKDEGQMISSRICEVARKFLKVEVEQLGSVPFDKEVQKSTMLRQAASEASTYTIAGQAWNNVTREILKDGLIEKSGVPRDFWREFAGFMPNTDGPKRVVG